MLCVLRVPTGTLPNCAASGVALRYPAPRETPYPESGTATVPFVASLSNVNVPDAVPAITGVNRTASVAVAPAPKLIGTRIPLTLKPLPVNVSPDSVTVVFPMFAMVTLIECVCPTNTFPKFTAFGVAVNPLARANGALPAATITASIARQGRVRRKRILRSLGKTKLTNPTWAAWRLMTFPVFGNAFRQSTGRPPVY
jgi:hypothetical protein